MIDEVEGHAEGAVSVVQRACRQAARRHVERDTPAVVDGGGARECDFAHDLRPHVQRRIRVLPGVVRQGGPTLRRHVVLLGTFTTVVDDSDTKVCGCQNRDPQGIGQPTHSMKPSGLTDPTSPNPSSRMATRSTFGFCSAASALARASSIKAYDRQASGNAPAGPCAVTMSSRSL